MNLDIFGFMTTFISIIRNKEYTLCFYTYYDNFIKLNKIINQEVFIFLLLSFLIY